jgi:glycosyltransferase involved in cell wall biosynthesis
VAIDPNASSASARAYREERTAPEHGSEVPTWVPRAARAAERPRLSGPLVSILINNYNYGRFLGAAIDSALEQTYPKVEVIVVDDGSTDGSRDIIAAYGGRIIAVLKENGGQGSAFNAGVAASRGDILCFLDADDVFHADKASHIVEAFRQRGLNSRPMMMHHLLTTIDAESERLEQPSRGQIHDSPLNRYSFAKQHRFVWFETGPTTTISINRALAHRLFPIPEEGVRISGDDFIVCGASLIGEIYSIGKNLGSYRIHGNNNWHQSQQKKSPEFIATLETYLNQKLVENGKSPVIAFNDSIFAWPRLMDEGRWAKLGWQMLRIAVRDRDKYTLLFIYHLIYHPLIEIGMSIMGTLRRKRDALLRRIRWRHPAR